MGDGILQKIKWAFILWLAGHLPDCKQMTRRLGESLDRNIGFRERLIMKLHLFTCDACERYLEQVTFLKEAMQMHGEREPEGAEFSSGALSADAKNRIKSVLRTSAF